MQVQIPPTNDKISSAAIGIDDIFIDRSSLRKTLVAVNVLLKECMDHGKLPVYFHEDEFGHVVVTVYTPSNDISEAYKEALK